MEKPHGKTSCELVNAERVCLFDVHSEYKIEANSALVIRGNIAFLFSFNNGFLRPLFLFLFCLPVNWI